MTTFGSLRVITLLFVSALPVWAQMRMIPHITRADGGFTTRLITANQSQTANSFQLTAFNEAGQAIATAIQVLPAQSLRYWEVADLFGEVAAISHLRIDRGPDIRFSVAYDTKTGTSSPVHLSEVATQSRAWTLFHGLDWQAVFDGLAIVNAGKSSANITIRHLNSEGKEVEPAVVLGAIAPMAKLRYVLADGFSEMAETYFEVSSKNPLALTVLRGTLGNRAFLTENVPTAAETGFDRDILKNAAAMMREGRQTFRYDTFGDEDFWGGTLKLHEGVAQVSPAAALGVGLKVDMQALPQEILTALAIPAGQEGALDLNDPAITLALLKLNAVVGVTGFFENAEAPNALTSIGIQCALCHATVDDAFAPGIGNRRDGWPNRDLNVGAIVALASDLSFVSNLLGLGTDQAAQDAVRGVLRGWGPGKFDAAIFLDGKFSGGPGSSTATLIPPAYGMSGTHAATYTGWGSVTYWNAFVANLEMHGKGRFRDPRLNNGQFPIAAANGFADVSNEEDLITGKLAALNFYQMALPAPTPPPGSFDEIAAARGETLFNGKARCASCHVPPLFTEPGLNLHTAQELGIDDFQASRSPTNQYRTAPLKGLWSRAKGGYYHDGRFADVNAVINHYNSHFGLQLSDSEKTDLAAYLNSL